MLPITVNLQHKKCLVVGGGKVALRRAKTLLEENAKVTVISPTILPELAQLVDGHQLKWLERPFRDGDTIGAFLVIAATNRRAVNAQIGVECNRGQLLNIADDPEESNFFFPAIGRKGLLTIAVSTEGASPVLAKKIRDDLMCQFDDEFEEYVSFVKEARQQILKLCLLTEQKRELLQQLLDDGYLQKEAQMRFIQSLNEYAVMA